MDPREKNKPAFADGTIIQLVHQGTKKRVIYNQITSANLAMAFNLDTAQGLFLRRPDHDIMIFPAADGTFQVPMDGAVYEIEQRIMKAAAQEIVLDTSVPAITDNNAPVITQPIKEKICIPNTPDQANITFPAVSADDTNSNNNNTNQFLDPIPELNQPQNEIKEKPKKPKAMAPANNNNNNFQKIEENAMDVEMAHDLPIEQKDEVMADNNTNMYTPPPKFYQRPYGTDRNPHQLKKNNSAKKKRLDNDSDDSGDDYTPNKKSAKKESNKKRGRKDSGGGEEFSPNKRQKVTDGSPKKIRGPKYFFARFDKDAAIPRDNGKSIAGDVKSWVTAVENLPEKDMKAALNDDQVETKDENTTNQTAEPAATSTEEKSPKLKKSPSQIKIEKQSHKVDVEKFYECLRPTDWTHQAPEKPHGLECSLLAYQRRAVSWMIAQERRSRARLPEERVELDKSTWGPEVILGGKGILADEMGLGKTIELIALILLNDCVTNDGNFPVRTDEMTRVRNTLIVAPNILVNQWCSELQKHAPCLTVSVYDGMQTDPSITKDKIKNSHVVVTSYEVLRQEIHYVDDFHMALRRSSQAYEKPKTPLVNFTWWRVCIDEAQEVKTSTNQAAAMVSRIPAIHRWAVTGTPVKSSFEDIRGLLIFLGLHEYWEKPTKDLLPLLGKIMWRHAKAHVQDDIAIPGTTMHRHTLNLSKFEKFCLEFVVKKQKSISEDTQNAQNELAKFFSAPFAVVYDLMELKKLKVTDKNKSTCLRIMLEESIKETRQKQAQLCDIMNEIGDASFAMFEKDAKRVNMLELARDSYQSILDLIFENKDSDLFMKVGRIDIGDDSVNVPALLNSCPGATFHALMNLSRVIASRDSNKDPQSDDHLERAQVVQLQHLGPIKNDVSKVAEKYKRWRREINAISSNRKYNYRSPWWVRILKFIKNGKSPHFTEKSLIKSLNSGVIQSYNTIFTQDRSDELKLSVSSIDELIERITLGLQEMEEARTNAVKALKGELPVSLKELDAFEKAIENADAMLAKYESSVATPDNTTALNSMDKKDALIQTKRSAKLNETERLLLFLEKIVINDSNYYFHLIVPKVLSKSSVNPTATNVRDRQVLSILTEDKQVNTSVVLGDEKNEVDKQTLINEMKFVKNIQQAEIKDDNNTNKINFENLDPFQEFNQDNSFKPRMEVIEDMPALETVANDNNEGEDDNNNNNNQVQPAEDEPFNLTSETFLHYKFYDTYNKSTERSIHYLSLCYHEASTHFKEFEYIKLEVLAAWDLIEALTKYGEALKEFESKAERKTFDELTKEEINAVIQTSITRRAEATTACKKQLEDIAFLLNERKLLQDSRPEESYGSKLAKIIDLLEDQLNEDKECKALVFSSWSEPLVQLADLLKKKTIQYTAGPNLQGMHAQKTHAERINSFKDNQAIRVMLLSALKQSTGLTLTQANHVVLMDHIEKSSEDQAIGRAYRIGQTKSTHVYKYAVNLSDVRDDELKDRIKKINKDKVFIRSNVADAEVNSTNESLRRSFNNNNNTNVSN